MQKFPSILAVLSVLSLTAALQANQIDAVINYDPGINDPLTNDGYQANGNAAIGLPNTTDGFGTDVTPFTPVFALADLTEINSGGHITLHFAAPITPAAGRQIGVYTNIGITANFDADTGAITASSATFAANPTFAIISVSDTGLAGSFVALNAGNPIALDNPISAFSDSTITYDNGFIGAFDGTIPNDFFKPFNGTFSDFTGKTYAQINTALNGSAGGNWLDISGTGLAQVNYIRFDVPAGDTIVLDAVVAIPEPSSLGLYIISLIALARRKQR